jgi:glucose-6-phosphate dehydrogenase assembly protein OpcA
VSDASTDAFLSGQGIPIELPRVEDELQKLWGPAAEREGGPTPEHPTVTRLVLANLVVAGLGDDGEHVDPVLDTVVARYPCRSIVLRRGEGAGRSVSAEVSALCHLPAPGLPQVCSERIGLRASPEGFELLPAAVRTLLEAGLPFVLWWVGDPRPAGALFRDLADEATRLVLDLPDPGAEPGALALAFDLGLNRYGRDLAWFGVARWRELVAQFFDAPGSAATLDQIASVEVRAEAPGDGHPPRVATWLVAWLAGQLGWRPVARTSRGADHLGATFHGPTGEVAVSLRTTVTPSAPLARVWSVALTTRGPDGEGTFRLDRPPGRPEEVRIEVCAPDFCALPRLVRTAEFDLAHRVAAALESSRDDPPYRKALPNLLWLMGKEG